MPAIIAFEDFELDELRFELRREGQRVRVQPKVLRLLFYLVQHRQRSVATEDLLAALWPGERVTTASIKRAIAGARRALGESAESQVSIRTVRGHGYQFVRAVPAGSVVDAAEPAQSPAIACGGFVGREQPLSQLGTLLAQARAGQGQVVLVSGAPGIGKTRLLQEFGRRAADSGALAWFGRCSHDEGAPALWPLVQVLGEAVAELCPDALLEAMGPGAADIAFALPELRRLYPLLGAPPDIGTTAGRFRFFDSLTCFLKRIAARGALCLLLDDLQHADALTLQLLAFLGRQLDRSNLLIAASMRVRGGADTQSSPSLRELLQLPNLHDIELPGLAREELETWIGLRTSTSVRATFVTSLQEQTGGNPLFIEHALRALGPHQLGQDGGSHGLTLPTLGTDVGLQRAIEQHLANLTLRCRQCLRVASVFGPEFSLGPLAEVLQLDVQLLSLQLSAAVEAGLVRAPEAGIGSYAFAQALFREVLYEQIPHAERARLHGRAACVLEARNHGSELLLSQLANHYLRAAPNHDAGRALPTAVRAAEAALQRGAYEEAAVLFERARHVLELGSPDPHQRLELLLAQGEALAHSGDARAASAVLYDAVSRARQLGARTVVVRAATALGQLPETGSVDRTRIAVIEYARSSLSDDDPQAACLAALHAKALTYSRDRATCTRIARTALAAAEELQDSTLRAQTLIACLHGLAEPDCLEDREHVREALARIGHERHDHRSLLWSEVARVGCAMERGVLAVVDTAIASITAIAEHARDPFQRWHGVAFRAMRCTLAGQLEEAAAWSSTAYTTGLPLGAIGARHVYCTQMSTIFRLQGRPSEAEELVREVTLTHPAIAGWQATLACLEAERGQKQHPRSVLERLLERELEALRADPFALSVIAGTADLCLLVGDATHARPIYDALRPYAERHGSISIGIGSHGPLSRHLARLALQMHEGTLAERHIEQALAMAEAMPSPVFISASLLTYAHILLVTHNHAGARAGAMAARALQLARTHGLQGFVPHAEGLLALASSKGWGAQRPRSASKRMSLS